MNTTLEIAKVALSYGKIINRGRLTVFDLRVLTEAGLPIMRLLADKYTELHGEFVSVSDVFERMSNGLVSANMISDILKDLTIKTTDNMNTTLEIPEGSKATIQGKVIDGKNYLVVEVEHDPELKGGDLAIFWNDYTESAIISVCKRLDDNGRYVDHLGLCWDNAIKWDGTKEQFEGVIHGRIK